MTRWAAPNHHADLSLLAVPLLGGVHDPSWHQGKFGHYLHIIARRAWEHHQSQDTTGRWLHAALAVTYQSQEVSWGPWVSLPGCVSHWSSSSAQLQTAAWPSSCHLSSPGPGDVRGKRLMQGDLPRDGQSPLLDQSHMRPSCFLPWQPAGAPTGFPTRRHLRRLPSRRLPQPLHSHSWAGRAAAPLSHVSPQLQLHYSPHTQAQLKSMFNSFVCSLNFILLFPSCAKILYRR